ncbi:2-dehydro-3-deoxy-6-phosphogalactonate aldolase [Ideonella sp. BN130291]|uniref:2-dehydro-3-deoxy-6-phosphogalactonate aldolase n=1 Tax=Ideonella sp. BN130291 TaxID=3112940 RepID=UPI002E274051|nr:2-dehydro-3-deoxy-6-phosphogalactonate aldolase [Ideonella sp. BN130291]
MTLTDYQPPLVAILRGLTPAEVPAVARLLFDAGWRLIEVPLNRPQALQCIAQLVAMAPADALVGGGTMLSAQDVDDVHAAGGRLMVAPNCDPAVIERGVQRGMQCLPGVATPTEALLALRSGAHALKLFPADMVQPAGMKAMASILPPGTGLWPVGGITPQNMGAWRAAGAAGFGIGGSLYQPGKGLAELERSARAFMAAWQAGPA